ncbi:MAG: DUF2971 domain-containing protein [Clostridiales bacterium]|nr:DUF2971 domain-containing protein [Clostridiales bacterium]
MSYIKSGKMGLYLRMVGDSFAKASENVYAHYCSLDSFIVFLNDYIEGKKIKRRPLTYSGRYDKNIVETPYVTFFASNLTFLNDRKEFDLGKNKVLEHMNSIPENELNKEIFVSCFCSDSDSLTQWKYYGKNSGLAVVFDTENVLINYYDDADEDASCKSDDGDMVFDPREVLYKDYDKTIDKMLSLYSSGVQKASENDIAQVVIPYIKDEYFEDEHESRIALYNIKSEDEKPLSHSNYRVSSNKIIPYLKMKMFYKDDSCKLPIKSITIGPGDDQDLIMEAVCNILSPMNDYDELSNGDRIIKKLDIRIHKSSCPFKG